MQAFTLNLGSVRLNAVSRCSGEWMWRAPISMGMFLNWKVWESV